MELLGIMMRRGHITIRWYDRLERRIDNEIYEDGNG